MDHISTAWGRGRTWLRVALMDKTLCASLAGALRCDGLAGSYQPHALLASREDCYVSLARRKLLRVPAEFY